MSRYVVVSDSFTFFDTEKLCFEYPCYIDGDKVTVDVLNCFWKFGKCYTHTEQEFGKTIEYRLVDDVVINNCVITVTPGFTDFMVTVNGRSISLTSKYSSEFSVWEQDYVKKEWWKAYDGYGIHLERESQHRLKDVFKVPVHYMATQPIKYCNNPGVVYAEEVLSIGLCEPNFMIGCSGGWMFKNYNVFFLGTFAVLFDKNYNFVGLAAIAGTQDRVVFLWELIYIRDEDFKREFDELKAKDEAEMERARKLNEAMDWETPDD